MAEKELKKLSRKQLLELLLIQTSRADELEAELIEARKKLSDREIIEKEAGSIAEAALRLNGIFEAAEAAAAQYLLNIKRISERLENKLKVTEIEELAFDSCSSLVKKENLFTESGAGDTEAEAKLHSPGWLNILLSDNTKSVVNDEE